MEDNNTVDQIEGTKIAIERTASTKNNKIDKEKGSFNTNEGIICKNNKDDTFDQSKMSVTVNAKQDMPILSNDLEQRNPAKQAKNSHENLTKQKVDCKKYV